MPPRLNLPAFSCVTSLVLAMSICMATTAGAAQDDGKVQLIPASVPALWGYGVKPCPAFLAAAPGEGTPTALADPEYLRYREWLAGLVTGLNLATGRDVLLGAELDAALLRIRASCQSQPEDDFFNASLRLVRSLGQLKGK